MIRAALPLCLLLSACDEARDQGGHFAAGFAMAKDVGRWASAEDVVDLVDAYGHGREAAQSGEANPFCTMVGKTTPDHWSPPKKLDAEMWRLGAVEGVEER
jgi:hypothetical protein